MLPITIRKDPISNGTTAVWNDIIESGVRVKPRSLNIEAGVNIPLNISCKLNVRSYVILSRAPFAYHQALVTPSFLTIEPQ